MMPKDLVLATTTNNNNNNTNNNIKSHSSAVVSGVGGGGGGVAASVSTPIALPAQLAQSCSVSATAPASPALPAVYSGSFYQGSPSTPLNSTANGSAGFAAHKNSLKSNKLARRARSFKDDLFEKISLMRTPTSTLGRSQSPQSPRAKSQKAPATAEEVARSSQSLDTHVKDISNALKHFRDVVLKRKLEVLPGNGTVILETIASMYAVIQSYMLNESSATLLSATQQVYQCLAKLIKLCDQVMLCDDSIAGEEIPLLSSENVKEIVDLLEDAVRNLASLAQQKLREKEVVTAFPYGIGIVKSNTELSSSGGNDGHLSSPSHGPQSSRAGGGGGGDGGGTMASMATNVVEVPGQRTSLPDITLTPKERDVLERNSSSNNQMRVSYSTESILRETSPPPKPPLPNRCTNPPPLPPKRNNHHQLQMHLYEEGHNNNLNSELEIGNDFPLAAIIDHLSVHSRSPDENSSQCSLDSSMNHSSSCRDEEEHHHHHHHHHTVVNNVFNRFYNNIQDEFNSQKVVSSRPSSTVVLGSTTGAGPAPADPDPDLDPDQGTDDDGLLLQHPDQRDQHLPQLKATTTTITTNHRHSNESGFISINSFRTSSQSYSKRSSDFSFQSSTKSSNSSSDVAYLTTTDNNGIQEEYTKYMQQSIKTTTTTSTSTSQNLGLTLKLPTTTTTETGQLLPQEEQEQEHLLGSHNPPPPIREFTSVSADVYSLEPLQSPPALPPKTLRNNNRNDRERQTTLLIQDSFDTTDNHLLLSGGGSNQELAELRHHHHPLQHLQPQQHQHPQQRLYQWPSKHTSLIEQRHLDLPAGSCNAIDAIEQLEQPPPLPMKKKHILAYMEICSATTRSLEQHRHTMHTYNLNRNISHSHTMNIVPLAKEEVLSPDMEAAPPALPPKNYKQWRTVVATTTSSSLASSSSTSEGGTALSTVESTITPPSSPKNGVVTMMTSVEALADQHNRILGSLIGGGGGDLLMSTVREEELHSSCPFVDEVVAVAAASEGHESSVPSSVLNNTSTISSSPTTIITNNNNNNNNNNNDLIISEEDQDENHEDHMKKTLLPRVEDDGSINHLPNIIEELDVTPYLVFKKDGEDGPEVKGGYIDALIIHASHVQKVTDNAFSEAFITTFRTFIQPIDVIEKLIHRYTVFFCQSSSDQKQKATKETFSLLVRVVNDLSSSDLTGPLLTLLVEFVYQLVCGGQLYLAKLLRNKIVEKVTVYKELRMPAYPSANEMFFTVVSNQPSLLDLKSLEIAEQMTLLDAELFQKIEIPEVLLFAKEQCEEKSPNLNKFTEHFNKMSYWARSKILTLTCAKEREKHVIKFIKIMKHLRKMNNYNSYLALLSALDSAPIRRLEWHKTVTDGLKEYCTLIDSSSSFRAYRQALADTQPPCIPYIGLVLQDLTFVHVGNPDSLKEGVINFSKRWQQYNIIDNMKRFKKCAYPFRRNDRIIKFFENFENFLGEEQMWEISETIKPRGKRTIIHN